MEREFSFRTRRKSLNEAAARELDLVVIGGGITGAGIAWDAASRGMDTAVLERGDFAHATSSKTSKMIHGGLRYLRNLQVSLVRESLRERHLLLTNASELVSWLPIVIPIYSLWDSMKFRLGLSLYDVLAREPNRRHRSLSEEEIRTAFPFLTEESLRGGLQYWDGLMDDSRLCLAVMVSAAQHGALVANYAEVIDFITSNGRVSGVRVRDRIGGEELTVRARKIVNATGPWTERLPERDGSPIPLRLRPNRGAHLIFSQERLPATSALAIPLPEGRLLFVIPWKGRVVLGTTESPFAGDLDCVAAQAGEVDFLLGLAGKFFPKAELERKDILASFAGVRPLVHSGKASLSRVSREHKIVVSAPGLVSVAGGKFTTFRRMAEVVVDRIAKKLQREGRRFGPCRTGELRLDGVLPSSPGTIPSAEEIRQSVQQAMTLTLSDLLVRRAKTALLAEGQGWDEAEESSRILAAELGWNEAERLKQLSEYRRELSECFKRGAIL